MNTKQIKVGQLDVRKARITHEQANLQQPSEMQFKAGDEVIVYFSTPLNVYSQGIVRGFKYVTLLNKNTNEVFTKEMCCVEFYSDDGAITDITLGYERDGKYKSKIMLHPRMHIRKI